MNSFGDPGLRRMGFADALLRSSLASLPHGERPGWVDRGAGLRLPAAVIRHYIRVLHETLKTRTVHK